jgi:TrmH family RNA methyltransferase
MTSPLKNVSIVLVDTRTPANIGAVARSMMNMGLSRLVLVRPRDPGGDEARRLAAGASQILDSAEIHSSLQEAVAREGLVFGTSRHPGRKRKNIRTPRDMAAQTLPFLSRNRAAVVFGNEVNGLEIEDLMLCHEIISIPSSEEFPSLNLAHAVMIVAYELFTASRVNGAAPDSELAPHRDLELFYGHLQETLQAIEFLGHDRPERIMFAIRQIFGRARLEARDLSILRGILTSILRKTR